MELCGPSKPLILEAKCVQRENKAVICDLSVKSTRPLPLRGWISNVKPQAAVDWPGTMCKINKQKRCTTQSETWPRSAHFRGWTFLSRAEGCWPMGPTRFLCCSCMCLALLTKKRLQHAQGYCIAHRWAHATAIFFILVQTRSTDKPGCDWNICTASPLLALRPPSVQPDGTWL